MTEAGLPRDVDYIKVFSGMGMGRKAFWQCTPGWSRLTDMEGNVYWAGRG